MEAATGVALIYMNGSCPLQDMSHFKTARISHAMSSFKVLSSRGHERRWLGWQAECCDYGPSQPQVQLQMKLRQDVGIHSTALPTAAWTFECGPHPSEGQRVPYRGVDVRQCL